jgi:hypothetical protein
MSNAAITESSERSDASGEDSCPLVKAAGLHAVCENSLERLGRLTPA